MKRSILVITFEGLSSPVFQNQFIPTALVLSREYRFSVISVEKNSRQNRRMIVQQREMLKRHGIMTFPLPSIWLPLKLSLPINVIMVSLVAFAMLICKKVNAIHIRRYDSITIALLARMFGWRIIFDPRGLFVDEKIQSGTWRRSELKIRVFRYFEKKILEKCDAVIAFSKPYRRYLERLYGRTFALKVVFVPNSVNLEKFRHTRQSKKWPSKKRLTLVYVGGASYWHLVDEMIYFFKCLKRKVPCFFLYIAYEGKKFVVQKFRSNNVNPDDFLVVTVPSVDIPQWLSNADVGIALIESSLAKKMCAPIKFVEYLAAGLPVVINPGIGETEGIVQKYRVGVIYERAKIQRNIAAILKMLDEKDIRDRCRNVIERHFALEVAVKGLMKTYQMALRDN
jgi:glycosyltransferase involved in cell wall biosynthesis